MAQKELAIRLEKAYDLPKSDVTKYDILAYFKQQEAAKNQLENAMIEQTTRVALSQAMPSGSAVTNNTTVQQAAPVQVSVDCPHPKKSYLIFGHEFTVTDLLLCFITFFLFILLIIHD